MARSPIGSGSQRVRGPRSSLPSDASRSGGGTVLAELRRLIESGVYLPGQAIRQDELASRLGVSRVPVREALQALYAEGLLRHAPNFGFSVARLTASELEQVYLMRHRVETYVLRAITRDAVTPELIDKLRSVNDELRAKRDEPDLTDFQRLNHRFHWLMFQLPNLDVFEDEINRLWRMSAPYRSIWAADLNRRRLVTSEHESMIDALAAHDVDRLCALMDIHRGTTAKDVGILLAHGKD